MTTTTIFTGGTTLDDLAGLANASHAAAESAVRAAVVHARDAGQALLAVKERLPHGAFGAWVRDNCKFSERQAQRYIRIAEGWARLVRNELGDDVNPNTTRASELSIEGLSIRGALRILSGGETEGPTDRNVITAIPCPSCGAKLAEIRPGVATCIECPNCRMYGTRNGRASNRDRYPYHEATAAWQRMAWADREEFLRYLAMQLGAREDEE